MTTATHFFLGANSGQGFQNLFDRFCAPEDHYDLAVLKGGPGVGKSTLMAKLGAAMEARGEAVELKTYRPVNGAKRFTGDLVGLVDGKIVLQTGETETMSFDRKDVAIVRLLIEFDESDLQDDAPQA